MRTKAPVFILLTVLLSLPVVPVHAQSLPPLPHAFYGGVTINGEDAPVGTVVTAKASGIACGSYIVKVAGQYGDRSKVDYLAVTCAGIHSGDTISFYVHGVDTSQTGVFESGGITELDLSVTIATPVVTTNTATSVTTTSATLNGYLSGLGTASSVIVSFEWGTTISYGNETVPETMTSTSSFSAALSGLTPATTYHFRAKVGNSDTSYGSDKSFATTTAATSDGDGITPVAGKVSSQGVTTTLITAKSEDGVCRLTIAKGNKVLDKEGSPLSQITIVPIAEPPVPSKDASVIGLSYDFGPDGATFNPPITLEFSYDPSDIPAGANEEGLVIAYYDKDANKWIELESTVSAATNTVATFISHFTAFAILGYEVVVAPAASPADFTISSLMISPAEATPGETVTISILVANIGGQPSSYEVTLKIDGTVKAVSSVTVAAGVTKQVSFTTAKDAAGTYSVDVSGLSGSFTVKEVPQESPEAVSPPATDSQPATPPPPAVSVPINWPIIGGIIAAIVVIALLIFSLARRRV